MKKTTLLLPLLAALSFACHREATPVGRLEVEPRAVTLAYPQLVPIRLSWTPGAASAGEVPSEPLVFLHLLDAKGAVLRTWDHPFPQHWSPGTPVSYEVNLFQSALAPPLDPGKYRLSVGLFDRGGQRWAIDGLGKPLWHQEYQAGEVTVPPQTPAPQLTFSPAWLPLEAGSDKQILARRRLSDQPGEIRLEGIPGPGTVWLSFRIPQLNRPDEKVVFHDANSNSPSAVVRCSCGSVETGISGPGPHEVEMPVDAAGAGVGCRITLTPNFHIVPTNPPQIWSVSLQAVAWIPAGGHSAATAPPSAH